MQVLETATGKPLYALLCHTENIVQHFVHDTYINMNKTPCLLEIKACIKFVKHSVLRFHCQHSFANSAPEITYLQLKINPLLTSKTSFCQSL